MFIFVTGICYMVSKISTAYFYLNCTYSVLKHKIKKYFGLILTHEKFKKDMIKIPYFYNDTKYYYLFQKKRGLRPISFIHDENGIDITKNLLPYLGPNYDCILTPSDFGHKEIVIENTDGIRKKITEFERICF